MEPRKILELWILVPPYMIFYEMVVFFVFFLFLMVQERVKKMKLIVVIIVMGFDARILLWLQRKSLELVSSNVFYVPPHPTSTGNNDLWIMKSIFHWLQVTQSKNKFRRAIKAIGIKGRSPVIGRRSLKESRSFSRSIEDLYLSSDESLRSSGKKVCSGINQC